MRCIVFTLTFDSSPIKGEGILLVVLDLFTRPVAVCQNQDLQDYRGFTGLVSRLRGNDGPMWLVLFTLTPVSGTGTGFGPLPPRERGFGRLCWLVVALHSLPLWVADQVRNDVTMRCIVFTLCSQCQALGHPHL